MKNYINTVLHSIILTSICHYSIASEKVSQHNSEYGIHVHGIAEMTVMIDRNFMVINFNSPAANLLNFEHQPSSASEQEVLTSTLSLLMNVNNLFLIAEADCQQLSQKIQQPYEPIKAKNSIAKNTSHQQELPKDKDKDKTNHSEFHVEYKLKCAPSPLPTEIKTRLFKIFPALESIQLQWVNDNHQGEQRLTPEHNMMRFTE